MSYTLRRAVWVGKESSKLLLPVELHKHSHTFALLHSGAGVVSSSIYLYSTFTNIISIFFRSLSLSLSLPFFFLTTSIRPFDYV